MTDLVRSVAVRLSANTSAYIAEMRAAGAETEKVSNRMTRTVKANGLTQERAFKAVATTAKLAGGIAAFGLYEATKQAANFGAEMALVRTLSHATDTQMQALSKTALTIGQNIGYGAHQVADGEAELVKAGVSIKNILGGALKGALDLAAAGQIDLGQATEIAASAMTQFKLKGKDVPHIADLLAAGADKALGSVGDLGEGLKQVGTTAHQMGFSIEETVGTLAEFAQAGLIGERGGTTFKQMLLQLAAPTGKAADLMHKYGISLYQANGQIKTTPQLAANLKSSLEKLTPAQRNYALGVIFGSRAIQGANILLKDGAKANQEWINKVNDSGFAAHQASGKLDSLKGDLEKLKAAAESAFIELGSGSQAPLREFVQNTTGKIREVTENGDLQRWSQEIGSDLKQAAQDAEPFARVVGGTLKNLAHDAHEVANAFNSLPKGVQQALITGGILAYGANKIGVLKPLVNELRGKSGAAGALGAAAGKGVVPVFVTNPGFSGVGGAVAAGEGAAAGSAASRGATAAAEAGGFAATLKRFFGGGKIADVGAEGLGLGRLAGLGIGAFSAGGAGVETGDRRISIDPKKLTPAQKQIAIDNYFHERGQLSPREIKEGQADLKRLLEGPAFILPKYQKFLKSLPRKVRTQIETPGALPSYAAVRRLGRQYDLTKKQVTTIVKLLGIEGPSGAKAQLSAIQRQILGLHDKTVHIKVMANGQGSGVYLPKYGGGNPVSPKFVQQFGVNGAFAGGGFTGQGGKHEPAGIVHRGEVVWSQDDVAAWGGPGRVDAMRQQRSGYAEGGAPGLKGYITRDLDLKFPRTLKQWENALEKSKNAIDKERSTRDDLISQQKDYASQLTGTLRKDPFSTDRPDSFAYMTGTQRTQYLRNNPVLVANQNAKNGTAYEKALKTLTAKGLNGEAFSELAATGDLQQVQAIAGETKAQIAVLEKAVNAGNAATTKVGKYAGGIVFDPRIDKVVSHLATMVDLQREIVHEVKHAAARRKASRSAAASSVRGRKKAG